ncbi:MAG: 23S rRNA (guanosine(2251)-2'-O)-methyltransferase RlmB [Candidatus Firestonebacteria bacterium]
MNRMIFGRNPVFEILKEGERQFNKILIAKELKNELSDILQLAKSKGINLQYLSKKELDRISKEIPNQGVILHTYPKDYVDLEDILSFAKEKKEVPFIILLDSIQDPHNLGAIIRTAECVGVHGIIIPKQRSTHVTSTVERISMGASEYMLVSRVSNLNYAIGVLKQNNIWIIGVEREGTDEYFKMDFKRPVALVFGGEGEGIKRSVKEKCDYLVNIPLKGKISSLNVSVSAGILMYEVVRQRK